jgi:hypothetical protein
MQDIVGQCRILKTILDIAEYADSAEQLAAAVQNCALPSL